MTLQNAVDSLSEPAPRHAVPSTTQPLSEAVVLQLMQSSEDMLKQHARAVSLMSSIEVMLLAVAGVQAFLGFLLIGWSVKNWNRHRRDILLITLFREKFSAELSPT